MALQIASFSWQRLEQVLRLRNSTPAELLIASEPSYKQRTCVQSEKLSPRVFPLCRLNLLISGRSNTGRLLFASNTRA